MHTCSELSCPLFTRDLLTLLLPPNHASNLVKYKRFDAYGSFVLVTTYFFDFKIISRTMSSILPQLRRGGGRV